MSQYLHGVVILMLAFTSCKKDTVSQPLNIELRHASLEIIKSNIDGNWNLLYKKGGWCNNCAAYAPGENVWKFSQNASHLKQILKNNTLADTTISWPRVQTSFSDSAFVMFFYDKYGVPNSLIIEKIKNDTLLLKEDAVDGLTFYLTKQ